jgi:hypothetical protein
MRFPPSTIAYNRLNFSSPLISSSTPSSVTSTDSSASRKRLPAPQSPVSRPRDNSPVKPKRARLDEELPKTTNQTLNDRNSANERHPEHVQNGASKINGHAGQTTTLEEWKKAHELEKEFPVVRDTKQALRYHDLFEVSI